MPIEPGASDRLPAEDAGARRRLAEELARCQLDLDSQTQHRVRRYCQLLWSWNEKLNLTRHVDFGSFVRRDLLDTVNLAGCIGLRERILDIGSGGGVPGLLLALLRPDLRVALSESVSKKATALRAMVQDLDVPVQVHPRRAECVLQEESFDTLTARAVGPLWRILKSLEPFWQQGHRLLLIKGPRWVAERGEARHRGFLKPLELRRLRDYRAEPDGPVSVILQLRASP